MDKNIDEQRPNAESYLRVKMFGLFDIQYKDMSILLESNGNLKPLHLLCFMLSQREKTFIAESVSENVWPGNEYIDGKKVIRTYIHRIRKILSQENVFHKDFTNGISIVNVKGNYKLIVADNVYFDIDHFDSLLAQSQTETDPDKLCSLYAEMAGFYNGEFLENFRSDYWVVMFRNHYVRNFCQFATNILTKLEEAEKIPEIINICESALTIYPLDENINIIYMKALRDFDRTNDALNHYSNVTQQRYNELSVSPSTKMLELYQTLKSSYKISPPQVEEPGQEFSKLDNQSLWFLINEAVRNHLETDVKKYAVGYVTVEKSSLAQAKDEEGVSLNLGEALRQALEFALRKNDMYSIIDSETAIIILHDAKEDFFNKICNRISEAYYKRLNSFNFMLKIKLYPVNTIV